MQFDIYIVNQVPDGRSDHEILKQNMELAVRGEELGFGCVWYAEHFFNPHGRPSTAVQAGYLAAKTKRIRVGSMVIVLPYHNPIEVAQDWATVDVLSGGRLNVGLGAGFFKMEFDGLNIPFEEARPRFEEAKEIVLKAWTQETFSYNGKYYKIPEVSVVPKPVQKPHPPIWMPATSPSTFKKCAQQRINAILGGVYVNRDELLDQFKLWYNTLDEAGVRHDEVKTGSVEIIHVSDTNEKAKKEVKDAIWWNLENFADVIAPPSGGWPQSYSFYNEFHKFFKERIREFDKTIDEGTAIGDPDKVTERIKLHLEQGKVDHLLCWFNAGAVPHELAMRSMELFAKHVMPRFARPEVARR